MKGFLPLFLDNRTLAAILPRCASHFTALALVIFSGAASAQPRLLTPLKLFAEKAKATECSTVLYQEKENFVPVARPYRRTVLQFVDGQYAEGGRWAYVQHPKYATDPIHYVRSYQVLLKDVMDIFDYIEPSDINMPTYSFRLHGIYMRLCIEVEANLKAILTDNGYSRAGNWNMNDYSKVEKSHFLSQYKAKYPVWSGAGHTWTPFASFSSGASPTWYGDYHAAKHDRHVNFNKANFQNVVEAMAALSILLASQFQFVNFSAGSALMIEGPNDGFDNGIDNYIRIKYPDNIPTSNRYDFSWPAIENDPDPFVNFVY